MFIDPPYFNADQDKFYTFSFSHDDHIRLNAVLQRHRYRIKFLLTYDNSHEIRDLYSWAAEIHDKEWNYTINRTDDQKLTQSIKNGEVKDAKTEKKTRYKGKEIFIMNYATSQDSLFPTTFYQAQEEVF